MKTPRNHGGARASGQRGGARLNFLIIIAVLALCAYVAYQAAPVAFKASSYKVYMQDTVDKAVALGQGDEWVRAQLRSGGADYGVPPNAAIEASRNDEGRMTARVRYTRPITLPGYTYEYQFDHTVKSGQFLSK
ncbi:MAG TPA: hypothetical protein VFX96_14690 [Pyrinomonadaceae bacterium]|nr:hypothetical protein [Pyrinomonadaceae bacterium]